METPHLLCHCVPCSHIFSPHNDVSLELICLLLEIGDADVCFFQDRSKGIDELLGVSLCVFQLDSKIFSGIKNENTIFKYGRDTEGVRS